VQEPHVGKRYYYKKIAVLSPTRGVNEVVECGLGDRQLQLQTKNGLQKEGAA
jgi:hypothetical protein